MNSSLSQRVAGKWHAVRVLYEFRRGLENWREVWNAYRCGAPIPPLKLRGGLTLEHGSEDDAIRLFQEIFVGRCYTRGGFYQPRAGETVLDLGANIGAFALAMQWLGRGVRVHSFEPASDTRARLERNVAVNGLEGLVTVHPYAVTGSAGTLTLKRGGVAGHSSLFASRFVDGGYEEQVQAVGLDGAVALTGSPTIDLLKIDIEGAEIEVVEGAGADTWARVRRVVVEYHDLFRPGCRERVARVLQAQGFARVETLPEPSTPELGLVRACRPD